MSRFTTVDEYIAAQPSAVQKRLQTIRQTVQQAAPQATERLSYGMPYFGFNGRLLYFSAFKHHIGFYPMKSSINHFSKELSGYKTSVATIQFPHDKPLPLDLIRRIAEFRAKENLSKPKK